MEIQEWREFLTYKKNPYDLWDLGLPDKSHMMRKIEGFPSRVRSILKNIYFEFNFNNLEKGG